MAASLRPPAWRLALFAAVAPMLLLGFLASALADRLIFAGWGIAAAALVAPVVHRRLGRRSGALAAALATAAPALALFGALAARHREALELGGRAVLGPLHVPLAAAPATWYLAAVAALASALAILAAGRARDGGASRRPPPRTTS